MKNKKDNIFKILTVVNLLLLVVCMFRISSLKQDNKKLENEINNISIQNENLKNNILSMVDSKLEQYNDILVSAYYDYEEFKFDINNLDTKIKVEVLPKVYEPNTTKVYLVDGEGQYYPLEYNDNKYVGEISIPLFEQLYIDHIILDDNAVLSSQNLNWEIIPADKVLPEIHIEQHADVILNRISDLKLSINGDISILVFPPRNDKEIATTAKLIIEQNNKEIANLPFDQYATGDLEHFELEDINKKYNLNVGDNLNIYIDITYGDFTIRRLIDATSITEDGNDIYDEKLDDYLYERNVRVKYQDKVLYDISEEIFK